MCCYRHFWCHMIYLFLCCHIHFTWRYPCKSSGFLFSCVSVGVSLGAALGGFPGFLFCVCSIVVGVWCCFCLVVRIFVTGALTWSGFTVASCLSRRCPLYMLVDCCSTDFVMMLNSSARLCHLLLQTVHLELAFVMLPLNLALIV